VFWSPEKPWFDNYNIWRLLWNRNSSLFHHSVTFISLKIPNLHTSFGERQQVSHPHKTTGEISFQLWILCCSIKARETKLRRKRWEWHVRHSSLTEQTGPVIEVGSLYRIQSISFLSPEDGNRTSFRNVVFYFLETLTMDKVQK
jgi:hypothetical protein